VIHSQLIFTSRAVESVRRQPGGWRLKREHKWDESKIARKGK